jgi:hypothetical protein
MIALVCVTLPAVYVKLAVAASANCTVAVPAAVAVTRDGSNVVAPKAGPVVRYRSPLNDAEPELDCINDATNHNGRPLGS